MREFQFALEDSQLMDLGFKGPIFTCTIGTQGDELTLERWDRAIANAEWCLIFNVVDVSVLPRCFSDHNPIVVSFSNTRDVCWSKTRSFRFEASWTKHPDHSGMVKKMWCVKVPVGNKWGAVQQKLNVCQKSFQHWVRKDGKQGEMKIKEKLGELQALQ